MAKDRSSSKPPPRGQVVAFRYNGFDVMRDASMLVNLTSMWRSAGSPANKEPREWRRKAGASFIGYTSYNLNMAVGHVLRSDSGRNGSTWGHWQIALAYAKYLSDEFHTFVNEKFRTWAEEEADPLLKVERGAQAAAAAGLSAEAEAIVARVSRMHEERLAVARAEAKAELNLYVGRLTTQIDNANRQLATTTEENRILRVEVDNLKAGAELGKIRPNREAHAGWEPIVPYFKRHGIALEAGEGVSWGIRATTISRNWRYEPQWVQPPGKKRAVNYYPPFVLEKCLMIFRAEHPIRPQPTLFDPK